jgi:hypothetical protein
MSMFIIRTSVRIIARLSHMCFTCMQPRLFCKCPAGVR